MPYSSMQQVNPSLKGIRPRITLEQANAIAAMADAIAAGENPPPSPWGAAISNFKKNHTVRNGAWVKRAKTQETSTMNDNPVMEAEKVTKREDGKDFPASDFAYVPDSAAPSTWKLRLTSTPGGPPDSGIVGAAIAALGKGFRGNKVEIPAADLPAVKAKVRAAWKEAHPDEKPENMPPAIKESIAECGPDGVYPGEFIPMDIVSLSQLNQQRAAQETTEQTQELFEDVLSLAKNILYAPSELMPDKPSALRALIDELALALPDMGASAMTGSAEVAEAATIKSKVRAAIAALDSLLEDKEVPATIRSHVKDLREAMRKNWADLANDATSGSGRQSESEPHMPTPQSNAPGSPEGVEMISESYATDVTIEEADTNGKGEILNINIQPIHPGSGNLKDMHYYKPEMLKANASKLVGAKMYETDHKQGEKNTRTWVSTITELKGFSETGAPIMKVAIHDPNFAQRVRNLAAGVDEKGDSLLKKLDCSLLASGTASPATIDGKQYKVVESIVNVESVDWVTRAGAGGHALEIAESDKTKTEGVDMTEPQKVEVTPINPPPVTTTTAPVTETAPATAPANSQPEGTVITIEAGPTYLELTAVQDALSKSNLPQIAKDKLAKGRYQSIAEVETAVKAESEYLAELRGSGRPFGQGASDPVQVHPQTSAEYDKRISEIINKYTHK